MAISISTSNPSSLLATIKAAIRDNKVETWSVDGDGDFTHTPIQWKNQAWLRPTVGNGSLTFNILKPQDKSVSTEIYAVYHGRFIEMLLAHFDSAFSSAFASAMATASDHV